MILSCESWEDNDYGFIMKYTGCTIKDKAVDGDFIKFFNF